MSYKARQEYLALGSAVRRPGWSLILGLGCVAMLSTMLLAGCSNLENHQTFPRSWAGVKPGMQREQVCALLGKPTHENIGAEEVYLKAMQNTHWELHIQYDAGGTVAAKRYYYFK